MIFRKIKIINFGPYVGEHEIEFNNKGVGIHLLRGGTGQGKTSIQNAFLWALYGKVTDRKDRQIMPTSLLNRKIYSDGIYYFGAQLFFDHEDANWILTRKMHAKYHQDNKYEEGETFELIRNGEGKPNPEKEIERIIPNTISRFFFFDGEMLRDYEELLDQKSTSMKKFKDSIERILGVPYFRIAKNDLNIVKKRVENERALIIRRLGGFEYEELLSQFDFVSENIDGLEKEITGLEEQQGQLEIDVTGNKRKMSDFEEVKDNAIKRNEIERDIKIIDGDIDKLNEKIKNLNINLYKNLLSPVSNNILGELENKHKEKMDKYDKKQKLLGRLESIEKGIKTSKCEYCGTILKPEKLISLEQEKKEINIKISDLTEIPEPNTSFDLYRQTLQRMKLNLVDQNNYKEIEKEKNDKLYKKAILTQNLTEVKEKLLNSDTKEPLDLENKIREQEIEVGRLEGIIQTKNSELLELKREKSEIDQKITSIDKKELNILDTRINVISSTIDIFETAIKQYVEEKRSDVERESSEIFKNLRSKEDFIKLIINENYGLGILTSEGTILDKNEWRSAGEEQLVALSLIGALNKCSNVEAPIMMDTPFGRLDLKHGQRVLSYLPKMSKEVILLATDREIREDDLKEVKSNIKTDYTIKYISEKEGSKISKTRSN